MPGGEAADIVIIGGGVIGLGIAYHLAELGAQDVLLIERHQLTSGTSWHAAGIVGPLRGSLTQTRLAAYAPELFGRLEAETGQDSGYRRTGGFWLAGRPERMAELRRIADIGEIAGIPAEVLEGRKAREQIAARAPFLTAEGLAGALWVAADGQANPVDICMAYAKGARAGGVRIREGVACQGIETRNGAVTALQLSDGTRLACGKLVNCAGAWARQLGALAGVPVPLQAVEHMYLVTEPLPDLPDPVPIVRDLEGGIYIKGDAGKLVLGGFEYEAKLFDAESAQGAQPFLELPEDWEQFAPFMTAGLARVPALERAGIQHFMNGPESFTPDSKPLLGESPYLKNFFVAAGFNSIGMMSSAGVGKAMAQWVLSGEAPLDLWELNIARFDHATASKSFLVHRMEEAVGDVFAMHWPFKQPRAGRGQRQSPLQEAFAAAGAVFGAPAGWERPLWFAKSPEEAEIRYSYGAQCWWPAAAREAEALSERVALLELSPFTKIEVQGPDALALLQWLCANDVDQPPGRCLYTQMLNRRGGIEADVTVTRLGPRRFRITSGAATRQKDLAWLLRQRDSLGLSLGIQDVTASEAVLGVMGPRSRALLQQLTDEDLSDKSFSFGDSRQISLGKVPLRATRMSFVGELGWELSVPADWARQLHDILVAAGAPLGLAHAGHFALESCRLEKGYRHWGHDIGPEDTPLEAGLAFALAWDKPSGFLGREALLAQRQEGVGRRLLAFAVEGAHPLLLHDEPIYRDGQPVGQTTSGGRGFRVGKSLGLAYVVCERGSTKTALLSGDYEISVAGERFPLKPLAKAAYDPEGRNLRGEEECAA